MFLITKTDPDATTLQDQIDSILLQMEQEEGNSPEFDGLLTQLERLYKLQAPEKARRVSPDAIVAVAGNLLGIVLILNYERINVVTSKALSFVIKSKI